MKKVAQKPIIAVDVDDVLADFVTEFCIFAKTHWDEDVIKENFTEDWTQIFRDNDMATITKRAVEMFASADFYNQMKPLLGAKKVLQKLSRKFDLVPLTSRVSSLCELTDAWLRENYGEVFREIVFSGAYESDRDYSTRVYLGKGEICREIGAEFLIDDQPKHANSFAKVGGKSLLFGDYSWNRDTAILPGVTRVADWGEVADYFGIK